VHGNNPLHGSPARARARFGLRVDIAGAVDHAADGGSRDAGAAGDIDDGHAKGQLVLGHRQLWPARLNGRLNGQKDKIKDVNAYINRGAASLPDLVLSVNR